MPVIDEKEFFENKKAKYGTNKQFRRIRSKSSSKKYSSQFFRHW